MSDARFPDGIAGEVSGTGPLICWAHGLSSSRARENGVGLYDIAHLPGYRVASWDAPGHGESAQVADDETTTWPRLGRLMLEIAAGLGAERFVASGASMGCATSLWAAVTDPRSVAAMILVIPSTAWESRATYAAIYEQGAQLIEEDGIDAYLDLMDSRPHNPSLEHLSARQRELTRAGLKGTDPVSLAHVLRGAAASNFPSRAQIAALEIPTLICSWEGDPQHPVSTGEELADLIAGSRFVVASNLAEIAEWTNEAATFLGGLTL